MLKGKCCLCGEEMDYEFPLLSRRPKHKICTDCSVQRSYMIDAANRNDIAAFRDAEGRFRERIASNLSTDIQAEVEELISDLGAPLAREAMDSQPELKVDIVIGQLPTGWKVTEIKNLVSADAMISVRNIQPRHEGILSQARSNICEALKLQAFHMNANAVVNIQFVTEALNHDYLLMTATGNAVVCERI